MTSTSQAGRTEEVLFNSSTHGIQLEAKIGHPALDGPNDAPRGLAIVAHPYGFLGGSIADPVTKLVARSLQQTHNYRTVRFNSRGVGKSAGRGSWTGEVEAEDYQTVAEQCIAAFAEDFPEARNCHLVIAGYSAGSLYASAVTFPLLPSQFSSLSYILISYPLDKLWALSMFHSSQWQRRINELVAGKRLLLVQGTRDQFTKHANYTQWLDGLRANASSNEQQLSIHTIEGGSHFYNGKGEIEELLCVVGDFVT